MNRFLSRRRPTLQKRPSRWLQVESLESRDLPSKVLATPILNLVPTSSVTAKAASSGNWSSNRTWQNRQVPAAGANVLIPNGVTVTLDTTTSSVHTIRVDGALQFSSSVNTTLMVDTLVINTNGKLIIGTSNSPIATGHQATITFTSNGAIDTAWDPNVLSRGLLALGSVTMYGAAVTPWVNLSQNAVQGATTLSVATVPTNWQVGDQIILGGTFAKFNQDETLQIQAISGTQVTLSSPLAYSHTSSNGIPVYVTDVTRNIVLQSQDQTTTSNRGHAMFLNSATNINYAEFLGLDRTNKSVVTNDPQLDSNGNLITGTGTNPRDRDSIDFYEISTNPSTSPAVVSNSTVVHSPGWGFVNHSSYVNFTNDVADDVNGASFISEAGDEIGTFSNNLAIHSMGTGDEEFYDPPRVAVQDWAHEGDGFWAQGNGISMLNNIAIGQAAAGYYYFFKPYTSPVQNVTPNASAINFHGDLAESCDYGAFLRYETKGGTIDTLTVHNCTTGYEQQYCSSPTNGPGIVVQNSTLYGCSFSDYGFKLPVESSKNLLVSNDAVCGYPVGMEFSEEYDQALSGGTWNNTINIEIPNSIDSSGRSITITNPTFVPNSATGHYDIYWLNTFTDVFTRNINAFFAPDTVMYNGDQLYAPWQQATYVPFPNQPSGAPAIPAALIGLTNQQLLTQFGIAMGGAIAPGGALTTGAVTNGSIGTPATYGPNVQLAVWNTNQLTGYQLIYSVNGGAQQNGGTYNLSLGWNMFTINVNGTLVSVFVFGSK
jgi:hypothetical protein